MSRGRAEGLPLAACVECGCSFAPVRKDQRFCCRQHAERHRKREQRLHWQQEGRCPQCGAPMDERPLRDPKAPGRPGKGGAATISYCGRCQERFAALHAR